MATEATAGGAQVAPPIVHLCPKGLAHRITLRDAPELAGALASVMPDWSIATDLNPTDAPSSCTELARNQTDGYSFRSWWAADALPRMGIAGAVCGAVADLVQAFCDERPGTIGLHCGAVQIGGQLVAFTGPFRAGKTTLVTRLGFEPDMALFCDDILPILPDGRAFGLGIQPRLRLPLPDGISPAFHRAAQQALTVHDARYGYVAAPNLAPHGTRAPLSALIVLDRCTAGPARLHRLTVSEAAQHFIRQNIADPGEIDSHFAKIAALAASMPCLQLLYSDLEQAVALLRDRFAGSGAAQDLSTPPLPADGPAVAPAPAALLQRFERAGGVAEQDIDGNRFLWQIEDRRFYALNPVARAVWVLLEQPLTGHALCEILQEAFPDTPPDTVRMDVASLLGDMVEAGLITTQAGA